MNVGQRTTLMLKYQKAKAKLIEYNTPKENYPHFPLDSNDLFFSTTYIISKYSEGVIEDAKEDILEFEPLLSIAAQYYDSAVNAKDREDYTFDFLLSGASAYFLSKNYGSAKVLSAAAYIRDDYENKPQELLLKVYSYLLLSKPMSYISKCNRYSKVNDAFLDYFEKGKSKESLLEKLFEYRTEIYNEDDPDEVYYVDVLLAVVIKALENSTWELLPQYSNILVKDWKEYLTKKIAIKMLWPAQRLIGECGILEGDNAIVQLPTGVGKTKSIELIIRAAFLANRANTVIIVAPLRALCNEITTDMLYAFRGEVAINQFSDVLQDDLFNSMSMSSKQIMICTPEKLSYVVHHDPDFLGLIDLFVFDEAHMFDDGERGVIYELLITHIKNQLSNKQQIILLSAVIPNAEDIKNWLFKDNGVLAVDSKILSTPKSLGVVSDKNGDILFYTDNPREKDYYIPGIIKVQKLESKHKERTPRFFPDLKHNAAIDIAVFNAIKLCNDGVAIYVGKQKTIKTVLKRLLELNDRKLSLDTLKNGIDKEESNKLNRFIIEYYGEDHCYSKAVHLGVLPHSANVPNGIKLAVEYAIKKRHIKCVVCTSTLAQGVNIPIKNLLVTSIRTGQTLIKKRNFQNLIGRTARSGVFTEGNIIITDPKIYAERNKGAGKHRWNECIRLFDSNSIEKCSSSILKITRDLVIDYDTSIRGKSIVKYILKHYDENSCFNNLYESLRKLYLKKKPNNTQNDILDKVMFIKQVVSGIENYLCLMFSVDSKSDRHEITENVCKNTLAYSLASDEEKVWLLNIFTKVEEKLAKYRNDQLQNYSYAMSGISDSLIIENWITEQGLVEVQYQEQELLNKIIDFFKESRKIKIKKSDKLNEICRMWINGCVPAEISQTLEMDVYDVDDICNKIISYELSFFIGNINDLIFIDEGSLVNPCPILTLLQKKVKYGVPSVTAVSICEKVFNDRILSLKITSLLGSTEIEADRIICNIDCIQEDIFALLQDYPQYFIDRIKFVLQ